MPSYSFNFDFIQTTYENFRYRYDKKENPYNKGILGNLKEMLCSEIPLSKNDFRSIVLVDEPSTIDSMTPNIVERTMNQKEKIDIEMGSMRAEDGGIPIPEILRNFDFYKLEEDMKLVGTEGRPSFDPFYSVEEDVKDSVQSLDTPEINFQSITNEYEVADAVQSSHAGDGVRESAQKPTTEDRTNAIAKPDDRNSPC